MTLKDLETWCSSRRARVVIRRMGTRSKPAFRVEASSYVQLTRLRTEKDGTDLNVTLEEVIDAHDVLIGMVPTT